MSDGGVERPFVSVVMPIRNEARWIGRSLSSVLAQDWPAARMEILVVDGMSDDGTGSVVAEMLSHAGSPASARLMENPGRIVSKALNKALDEAVGDVIVRVDGHCEIPPDYVSRCVQLLTEKGADNVGGRVVTVGDTVGSRAIASAMSSPFGVGGARFRYSNKPGWVDTVPFGAWPREVFDRIGRFDEELVRNQDDEFNFRLTQAGGKIWFDPSIRSVYRSRATLSSLWRQYFGYGLYKVRLIQKRGGVASWRHLVPPTFVVAIVASIVVSLVAWTPVPVLALAALYLAASIVAAVVAARKDLATLFVLPVCFATIHVAYGCGFWAGLWRFRGRARRASGESRA